MESAGDDGGLQREHGKMKSIGNDNDLQRAQDGTNTTRVRSVQSS